MNGHDTYLELAAASIDFPLTPEERRRLESHLAECAPCRHAVAAMRGEADLLHAIPVAPMSDRRADEMLATILAPPAVRHPLRLVLVAALITLLALGSIAVGASLLHRSDDLSDVPPAPSPRLQVVRTASADAPTLLGTTWLAGAVPTSPDRPVGRIEAVTAGGPGFVAVGRGCLNDGAGNLVRCEAVVWTSTDGHAWQRAPASDATDIGTWITMSGPENGMFDVAAGSPGVVAIGYSARPAFDSAVWFSPDGTSWERLAAPLGTAGRAVLRPQAVAWTGDRFVIVGEDRTGGPTDATDFATARARAAVWTSTDGRSWSRVEDGAALDVGGFIDTSEDPGSGGMADVVAGPDGLIAVGSTCTTSPAGCRPAAWTSTDGSTWQRASLPADITGWLGSIAVSRNGYVAVGGGGCSGSRADRPAGCPALVLTSSDGRSWLQQSSPQPGDLREIATIGDRLYATAPDGPVLLWASADGTTWSAATLVGGPGNTGDSIVVEQHLAATSDRAVIVGQDPVTFDTAAWYSQGASLP